MLYSQVFTKLAAPGKRLICSLAQLIENCNREINAGGVVPVCARAPLFGSRVAVDDAYGQHTYAALHFRASRLAEDIDKRMDGITKTPVAYLCDNDGLHVIVQWAIWLSGNIAVPLSSLHPPEMLQYFLSDTEAPLVLCSDNYASLLADIVPSNAMLTLTHSPSSKDAVADPTGKYDATWYAANDAIIIYTSGTTSKPKGVVWSHAAWCAQVASLLAAWRVTSRDVVLHALPLHHVHGQLNALSVSLAAGARVDMLGKWDTQEVWSRLRGGATVFHGVPTMYARLSEVGGAASGAREFARDTLSAGLRLACVGSAPCPDTLFDQWEQISGHRLLERYGMTEVGMALSAPYSPSAARTPGAVGLPLPGVAARIAAPGPAGTLQPLVTVRAPPPDLKICPEKLGLLESRDLFMEGAACPEKPAASVEQHAPPESAGAPLQGELLVRGAGIFRKYWKRERNPDDFTADGWFRTGDTASFDGSVFRIMGRTSVDIIKTSGYKVSALQVEAALLQLEGVSDAAVLGLADAGRGERVVACLVLRPGAPVRTPSALCDAVRTKLAPYQVPTDVYIMDSLPRNIMGKLDKKVLKQMLLDKK